MIALHLPNKDAGLRSDIEPYSRSWESRVRRGVKLDAIPRAQDHIAIYKRMGMDFPIKLVRKQRFRAVGVHRPRPGPLTFI